MARKKKAATYNRVCAVCGETFTFEAGSPLEDGVRVMVKHYEKKHPDRMSKCFDQYGQTWNDQYDACLRALHHTSTQRDEAIKQRDEAAAQQRTLAAKLNAIVLVLRND